jgi:hypothetical protein
MLYKKSERITNRALEDIPRDVLVRHVIHQFVKELPMDVLERVFKLEEFSPTNDNINKAFASNDITLYEYLLELRELDVTNIRLELDSKEYTDEEIRGLAVKRYGNDPHSWGGQRDGFIEGFKQALS